MDQISKAWAWIKGKAIWAFGLAAIILAALLRISRGREARARAAAIAAKERGAIDELQKETSDAESNYAVSRAEYERARRRLRGE